MRKTCEECKWMVPGRKFALRRLQRRGMCGRPIENVVSINPAFIPLNHDLWRERTVGRCGPSGDKWWSTKWRTEDTPVGQG